MRHAICFLLVTVAGGSSAVAADEQVIFRSDVSLIRVDAQVLDRGNRAITGLRITDFIVKEEGKPQEIRNFASENMPIDVLLLLDVSGSMKPHIQRLSSASHQALEALGKDDRVGIMVFDRQSRLRMGFKSSKQEVERELESLLRDETFNGGTDITRGLLDAAEYVGRSGRKEARHAIVILTDDQTERERNDEGVERALTRADAVLSALIAPDAMRNGGMSRGGRGGRNGGGGGYPQGGGGGYPQGGGGYPQGGGGGGYPQGGGGGGWPGSGGGPLGGPLGGIILGRRNPQGGGGGYPQGGGGYPQGGGGGGPVTIGSRTHTAGTSEIAQASGGDSMSVDDSSALENTLSRLRQRYALYFYLPEGVRPGQERAIEVTLSAAALQRFQGADVRYRRVYLAPGGASDSVGGSSEPPVISRAPSTAQPADDRDPSGLKRRPRGEASSGPRQGPLDVGGWRQTDDPPTGSPSTSDRSTSSTSAPSTGGGWRRADPAPDQPTSAPASQSAPATPSPKTQDSGSHGGWREIKPGEQP